VPRTERAGKRTNEPGYPERTAELPRVGGTISDGRQAPPTAERHGGLLIRISLRAYSPFLRIWQFLVMDAFFYGNPCRNLIYSNCLYSLAESRIVNG
jgi:hypothetical protein